jgi:hypothetical protein
MNSFKRLLSSTITLVLSFLRSTTNYIADGISERNMKKVALNLVLLLSVATLVILTAALFVKLAFQNLHILIAAAFLAAAAYSVVSKLFQTEEPTPPRKPTAEDYQTVLATVKPSLATVAPALGLAPIYEHSDIRADPEEQILPWGKVWRMKFKVLKQTATSPIDKDLCRSVIQAQIKSVLERENPSGFVNVRFQRGGTFVPIIQVDEVLPGDAFVYLFIAIASQEYFQQKADWENRKNVLPIEVNTDDEDF